MSKILIKLRPGFQPAEIKVIGVPGKACQALSKPFEKVIGGTVLSSTPTAEAAQPAAVGVATTASAKA